MFHYKRIRLEQFEDFDDEGDNSDDQCENLDDYADDNVDDHYCEEEEEEFNEEHIKKKRFIFTQQNVFNDVPTSDITNNYKNPWKSFDSYKNVMLNLTVENFLFPLRNHLHELQNHKLDSRDLYLYENVYVYPIYDYYILEKTKLHGTQEWVPFKSNEHDLFIHFEVRFPSSDQKRKINWENSERLNKGNLLIFSTSAYMDNIQAVAYSCSQKGKVQNNIIPIRFLQGNLDITRTYFMFEPVDHWTYSLVDNLLNSSEKIVPQCLIKPFLQLDFSDNLINKNLELFNFLKDKSFKQKINVDDEQLNALKYSLNHHLTLVNGAPGTGKTHLACEVVKYLINSNYKYPILVVSYKNVSLDNFLDKIVDFLQENNVSFIRVGGKPRTKNNYILEHNFKKSFPCKKLKRFLRYTISLIIIINNILEQIDDEIDEIEDQSARVFEKFIDEIDKTVNIRNKLLNKYKFFNKDDESLIMNFFNPSFFVPPANVYFSCYALDKTYFQQSCTNCVRYLHNECVKLVGEIKKYYEKKFRNEKDNEPNEIIDNIIKAHFEDENSFYQFLSNNKEMIRNNESNQLDILFSIIENSKNKTMSLKNYLKNNLLDFNDKIIDHISNRFDEIFSKKYKFETFTNFLKELKSLLNVKKKELETIIAKKTAIYQNEEIYEFGEELSTQKLIAMTATRASQYKESLDLSKCRFMIFEEAGELTEPITFINIPKSVIQLMMIGDYNQLRPTVEYKLSQEPFNFNISLFEKLVISSKKQKADNLFTLSIQRRMHPQISAMLRRAFYDGKFKETLIDDESVMSLGRPIGFPNHLQFWLHDFKEESDSQYKRSHSNIQEAKICARLFLMMLCRGYKSNEITIISLYKGQKKQIEREIANLMDDYYKNEDMEFYDAFDFENDFDKDLLSLEQQEQLQKIDKRNDFNQILEFRKSLIKRFVKCLDDFQGEENQVIIISLTRSKKPGFLKSRNRSLVTLSRAKQFEFIIGNKDVFGKDNKNNLLWSDIASQFTDTNTLGNGIFVCGCPTHRYKDICGFCKHFGCLPCPNECESRCSKCNRKCILPCGHKVVCQVGHIENYLNKIGSRIICDECKKTYSRLKNLK